MPNFKWWQVQEIEVSVLALLPEAPVPSKAQKGRPCHPHPLRYWLHQMLATLRNRAKNRFYNESVLRINPANSPPREDSAREAPPPPTSQPTPTPWPFTWSPRQTAEGLGQLYPNCHADRVVGMPICTPRWPGPYVKEPEMKGAETGETALLQAELDSSTKTLGFLPTSNTHSLWETGQSCPSTPPPCLTCEMGT